MILRLAFFAFMALGLAGFGTVAWISTRPPPPDAEKVAASMKVMVLVAAKPIRAGNLLKPEDVTVKEVSAGEAGSDSNPDTSDARHSLTGAMVRSSLSVGDVIRSKDIMHPGDHGFLAAVLAPGMRAVSVGVDAITGAAGLIWPGDRIDLILTQTIENPAVAVGRRIASETVLSGVRVIAIDQQIVQGLAPDATEGKGRTVTMEVTSEEAERVSVATRIGRLSLAVRSAEHGTAREALDRPKTTWASDVSPALGIDVAQGSRSALRVYPGSADSKEFRF